MRRLRQMQTRGGYPGGRGPQMPRGANPALFGGILLAGGAWLLSNSLFNVDGGHRAIKYQRLTGVSKEIYSEGTNAMMSFFSLIEREEKRGINENEEAVTHSSLDFATA